ncbi:hypothetical protein ACIRO1_35230, partial [Streptomyces sp. NPDC102381]|uniref:hypothetical protein n=1 Tax=Streptomyces sp. NPDC102381 TaxID=3366164 RepID=UPI003800AF99
MRRIATVLLALLVPVAGLSAAPVAAAAPDPVKYEMTAVPYASVPEPETGESRRSVAAPNAANLEGPTAADFAECRADAHLANGVGLDRFRGCIGYAFQISKYKIIDGVPVPVGNVKFRQVLLVVGDAKARSAMVYSDLADFVVTGDIEPELPVTSGVNSPGGAPGCSVTTPGTTRTLAQWELSTTPAAQWAVTSAAGSGQTRDDITYCGYTANWSSPGDSASGGATLNVRYDSADYFQGAPGGATFPIYTVPCLEYSSATGSPVKGVADHINLAFASPGSTLPAKTGKTIPGKCGSTSYLHRLYSKWDATADGQYKNNRNTTARECKKLPPP